MDPTGKFEEKMMEKMPVGRFGTVEELANLVAYMVSDYSSWLNGEVIQYDGGLLPSMSGMFSELSQVNFENYYICTSNHSQGLRFISSATLNFTMVCTLLYLYR